MQSKHNKQLVPLAKHLRKEMTKEKRHLWYDFLCSYPVRFSRQKVLGKYIADFYSAEAKLVIELDGSQHYEDEKIWTKMKNEPPSWKAMDCRFCGFRITKSTETSVGSASISMLR